MESWKIKKLSRLPKLSNAQILLHVCKGQWYGWNDTGTLGTDTFEKITGAMKDLEKKKVIQKKKEL